MQKPTHMPLVSAMQMAFIGFFRQTETAGDPAATRFFSPEA